MNIVNISIVYGAIISVLAPTGIGLKYYADHEYITVGGQLKSDIRELKRDIRDLEYDKQLGYATDKDLWLLQQLYGDVEELEDELGQ